MSDLVERLRETAHAISQYAPDASTIGEQIAAHIETLQAELAEARAKVEGHILVPIKPTLAMEMAGAEAITEDHMRKMANYDAACDCWSAMIEALKEIEP